MKHSYILILFLLLTACANIQVVGTGKVLKLHDSERTHYISLSDVFEPLKTIPLDNCNESILKNIRKVEFVDSCYYILGSDTKSCVFVFDGDGRFLRRIGTQGHGKGEYLSAWDFTVDKENGRVVILSAPSQVYIYSTEGTFIESHKLGKAYCWNITDTETGFVCSTKHCTYTSGDNAYLLYFFDKDFHVKEKKISVLPHQIYMPTFVSSVFFSNQGKQYYVDNFLDEVYDLSTIESGEGAYSISLSNPMPTENFKSVPVFSDNQRKYDFLKDVLLLDDKAVFVYIQNAQNCVETMTLSGKPLIHGCFSGNFPKMFTDGNGNALLCVSAYSFLKNNMEVFLPSLHGKVKASDNYILVKCKLKE